MNVSEYNKCVDEYADSIFRFIVKNIRDHERARDIVQDTFEKLWKKVDKVEHGTAKSYLFTTAYHTMIDQLRKEKFKTGYDLVDENNLTVYNTFSDAKQVITKALEQLNDIQRSVVLLRDYEGYRYDEIGKITGLSEAQVKVYIYRARISIKKYIGSLDKVI